MTFRDPKEVGTPQWGAARRKPAWSGAVCPQCDASHDAPGAARAGEPLEVLLQGEAGLKAGGSNQGEPCHVPRCVQGAPPARMPWSPLHDVRVAYKGKFSHIPCSRGHRPEPDERIGASRQVGEA